MDENPQYLELTGDWWLPERPKDTVSGTLRFSPEEGGGLELIGRLRDMWDEAERVTQNGASELRMTENSRRNAGNYPRIHGFAAGSEYTLEDCFRIKGTSNLFGRGSEVVRINRVLRGYAFPADVRLEASAVTFSLNHLANWVSESGLSDDDSNAPNESAQEHPVFRILAYRIPPRTVKLDNGRSVSLVHRLGRKGDALISRSLTQEFYFHIEESSGVVPMDRALDWASDLQDLVSIATGRPAAFTWLKFANPESYAESADGQRFAEPIHMFAQWKAKEDSKRRKINPYDLLFTFDDFGGIDGIGRWLRTTEAHRDDLGRVMATQYSAGMYASDRLLNCAAALEAFDRKQTETTSSMFKTRLKRCTELAGPSFVELVGDVDDWLEVVRNHRDEAAHHLGRVAELGSATTYLARSLYYLYAICLLQKSEIPERALAKIAASADYQWLQPLVQAAL